MNQLKFFDSFGEFYPTFHEKTPILIHCQNTTITAYHFNSLQLIARTAFKMQIIATNIPYIDPNLPLRFVVITEDEHAHVMQLKNDTFALLSSTEIPVPLLTNHVLLLDQKSRFYIFFETGLLLPLFKKSQINIEWPPDEITQVRRLVSSPPFESQFSFYENSASFLAFVHVDSKTFITSWILNFNDFKIIKGPFSIEISPKSQYISSRFFAQNGFVYSILPFQEIGTVDSIYSASSFTGNFSMISDSFGTIYKIHDKISEVIKLSTVPVRIETNGTDFVYLLPDGTLLSSNNPNSEVIISSTYTIEEYRSIMVRSNSTQTSPFPIRPSPAPPIISTIVDESSVSSAGGKYWKSPGKIVSSAIQKSGNVEFVIAATASSIHILKVGSEIDVLLEKDWEFPITAVAISDHLYGVAAIDNRVTVCSFTGEPYSFSFQHAPCFALSLSNTTLATGFGDGSFMLSALKGHGSLFNIQPLQAAIRSIRHVDDESCIVEWGEAIGLVSPNRIDWLRLPQFPASRVLAFAMELLALGSENSLLVYAFAEKRVLAEIPILVIGACFSDRHLFCLTVKHELVVLYCGRTISVDHQILIDVQEPLSIAAVDDTVYVLCEKCVEVFDKSGHLYKIVLPSPPHFIQAVQRGCYIVFARQIWFISRDQSIMRIAINNNISAFSAIGDERCCICIGSRIKLCEKQGSSAKFTTFAKLKAMPVSIRCYSNELDSPNINRLFIAFEDGKYQKFEIPPKQK